MDLSLIARIQGDPMIIARAAVQHLYEVDPNQPAGRIRSLEQVRTDSIAALRLTANLLGLFVLLALAIVAAGISGAMALSVSQPSHQIGVSMAIGPTPNGDGADGPQGRDGTGPSLASRWESRELSR